MIGAGESGGEQPRRNRVSVPIRDLGDNATGIFPLSNMGKGHPALAHKLFDKATRRAGKAIFPRATAAHFRGINPVDSHLDPQFLPKPDAGADNQCIAINYPLHKGRYRTIENSGAGIGTICKAKENRQDEVPNGFRTNECGQSFLPYIVQTANQRNNS